MYDASLFGAKLSHADLTRAQLSGADLTKADLSGAYKYPTSIRPSAGWYIKDQAHKELADSKILEQRAKSLKGATMPDGQKCEDWFKNNENAENSDPS